MFRILIFFLLFYIFYRMFKKIIFKNKNNTNVNQPYSNGEKVLPCKHCNVYVPESKGIVYKNNFFCSKKCLENYLENLQEK